MDHSRGTAHIELSDFREAATHLCKAVSNGTVALDAMKNFVASNGFVLAQTPHFQGSGSSTGENFGRIDA